MVMVCVWSPQTGTPRVPAGGDHGIATDWVTGRLFLLMGPLVFSPAICITQLSSWLFRILLRIRRTAQCTVEPPRRLYTIRDLGWCTKREGACVIRLYWKGTSGKHRVWLASLYAMLLDSFYIVYMVTFTCNAYALGCASLPDLPPNSKFPPFRTFFLNSFLFGLLAFFGLGIGGGQSKCTCKPTRPS